MDELSNPYQPGAGSPPPELSGRADLLEAIRILLGRLQQGRYARSMIATGLRGVGKTVLLNRFAEEAERRDFHTIVVEAVDGGSLTDYLVAKLRSVLFRLDRSKQVGHAAKYALRVLKSFTMTFGDGEAKLSLDIDPELGSGDSGDLHIDLTDLLTAIGKAAQAAKTALVIGIDEVQYLSAAELSALIVAMHRVSQLQLPLVLIATGLPQVPGLVGEIKSYAERLFAFPAIGALNIADACAALANPARELGVEYTPDALHALATVTEGYPYFLQEWAYRVWNAAARSPISLADVNAVGDTVLRALDDGFFRVRFDRLTSRERLYLRAMAALGSGPYRSADIAAELSRTPKSLGPLRDELLRKGMIYGPRYGEVAFTVPLFHDFMQRTIDDAAYAEMRGRATR